MLGVTLKGFKSSLFSVLWTCAYLTKNLQSYWFFFLNISNKFIFSCLTETTVSVRPPPPSGKSQWDGKLRLCKGNKARKAAEHIPKNTWQYAHTNLPYAHSSYWWKHQTDMVFNPLTSIASSTIKTCVDIHNFCFYSSQ